MNQIASYQYLRSGKISIEALEKPATAYVL